MGPRKKKKGKPGEDTGTEESQECKICKEKDTEGVFECDLCAATTCINCSSIPAEVHDFITQQQLFIPILCVSCKEEIPQLREMKGIKTKQAETAKDIASLREDNNDMKETIRIQGEQITRQEGLIAGLTERLERLEANPPQAQRSFADALNNPAVNTEISTLVRSEVSERAEIEKLKMNLVISGIAENDEQEDKDVITLLLENELNITPDIESTERIGSKTLKGKPRESPRLIRVKFVTQRSRREVLTEAINLRDSDNNQVKTEVYIRPDLTERQQKQSKNLRDTVKKVRRENPDKTYKIHKNKVICTSHPEVEVEGQVEEETEM